MDTIVSDDTLNESFKNGIYYVIYFCLNNSETIECLVPLLQFLINNERIVSISEVSEKFSSFGYLCFPKDFKDKKDKLKFQMTKIDKEKSEIIQFLLELCPNLDTFFVYIEMFNNEKCFNETISNIKSVVKNRILNLTSENNSAKLNILYEQFLKYKEFLNDFKENFGVYFISMCSTSQQLIQMATDVNVLIPENPTLLKQFLTTVIKISRTLALIDLLNIFNIYKTDNVMQNDDEIKKLVKEFGNVIINKINFNSTTI